MKSVLVALIITAGLISGCMAHGETETRLAPSAASTQDNVRLYALDCGLLEFEDIGMFSHDGSYKRRSYTMPVPCYLIRHPGGDLMWDAGLPDALNALPDGQSRDGMKMSVPISVESQLQSLGLTKEDIEFFAPSHSHFDHLGNSALFAGAELIISKAEHDYMFSEEAKVNIAIRPEMVEPLRGSKTRTFIDEYDVFGDGSVTIIPAPGHTPGHSVILVKLANTGPIMLTGDLYHLRESRERNITPVFNFDRDQTLASMQMFNKRAAAEGARVIVQHDALDWENTPKLPAYLD